MDHEEGARLREVMSRFPTGVTVVGGRTDGAEPWGLTVNSFTSVSLDPPLILVCIQKDAASHARLIEGGSFGVSVLAAHQADIARRFSSDPSEGRFADLSYTVTDRGGLVLDEAAAWLECTVREVLPGGDHSIVIGLTERSATSGREALVFYDRDYSAARA